ncbi:MAG: cell division protein ZapD [Pigmentiphaga sp.]
MILYEYPFNERIRNLLRLEDQLHRLFFFIQQDDPRAHHAGLATLFEIIDALGRSSGRADARGELLQELERQRQSLLALREHPEVAAGVLDATLSRLNDVIGALSSQAKPGDMLRQHEWLASLRSRLVIPGGVCEFDMPSYYAWQCRPANERLHDLQTWCQPLLPLYEGLSLALELLRQNHESSQVVARGGLYQQSPNGRPYQLLRVHLPDQSRFFPEISANKYSISIRFSTQDGQGKPQPLNTDVTFRLDLCTSL